MVDRFDGIFPAKRLVGRRGGTGRGRSRLEPVSRRSGRRHAVVAYYHLLPHRGIMLEPFTRGVPSAEASVVRSAYPLFAGLIRLLLRITESRAQQALAVTRTIFDEIDRRVADGRPHLVGDSLTLADLALATAAAPLLIPDGYGSPIPPLGAMPQAMQAIVGELREREMARFVQRIYRDHRGAPG